MHFMLDLFLSCIGFVGGSECSIGTTSPIGG
jgi:hypothetical protein